MEMKLPFYFTSSGKGWRHSPRDVTLRYEDGSVQTTGVLGPQHLAGGGFSVEESPVSGFYVDDVGREVRITNIVGFDGSRFLKYCPSCGRTKPVSEFGASGRHTTGPRDQSECSACRSEY